MPWPAHERGLRLPQMRMAAADSRDETDKRVTRQWELASRHFRALFCHEFWGGWSMQSKTWCSIAAALAVASAADVSAQQNGRQVISTPAAPNAIGPYSQAIRSGNTVYVSGEIAIDPKTNQVMSNATE